MRLRNGITTSFSFDLRRSAESGTRPSFSPQAKKKSARKFSQSHFSEGISSWLCWLWIGVTAEVFVGATDHGMSVRGVGLGVGVF